MDDQAPTTQTSNLAARPNVFLSSVFVDYFGGDQKYVPLRKRIIDNRDTLPVSLWAYDIFWPKGSEINKPGADMIIDRCFDGIRSCDLFVFLLTGRHGSGVEYLNDPVRASYLELELFSASMLRKPMLILHIRGHEPEIPLKDTVSLLHRAFSSSEYVIDDEDGLYSYFLQACQRLTSEMWRPVSHRGLIQLPDWLSVQRTRKSFDDDLSDPRLRFLDGRISTLKGDGNTERARQLLDQVASGVRRYADTQRLMPHGASLFRLWTAMRELMADKSTRGDPLVAPLWDRALGLWAGKASWFGLHGHLWLGPLAAVNLQIELRRTMAVQPAFCDTQDIREPLGARASAIYSIAQRMRTRSRKLYHYRQTIMLATQAIERDPNAQQGSRSIRAHALMQTALLGYVWRLWEAADDFKQSLKLRESVGLMSASVGQAKVDLGFCSVLIGRPRSGMALLQEGIALMRCYDSPNDKAFLAHGLRKLERAARLLCRRNVADEARRERLIIAAEIEALDQARE